MLFRSAMTDLGRKYDNYLGKVEDKIATLSGYKYSLVVENSNEYLSEKLVDVLLAGTFPLYVGPDLESFGLPSDVAITAKPTVEAISMAITQIEGDKLLRERILFNGVMYLKSTHYKKTINNVVLQDLAARISSALL